MKYFAADRKWEESTGILLDVMSELKVKYGLETVRKFKDYGWGRGRTRDYRYGLPSFDEAYETEFQDFVNLLPKSKRDTFKKVLKEKYKKVEVAHKNVIDGIDKISKHLDERHSLEDKRSKINNLLWRVADRKHYIVTTDEDAYDISTVFEDAERFYEFLKEKEVLEAIGKRNAEKLRNLREKACKANDNDEFDTLDDILDDIEEMLLDFFSATTKRDIGDKEKSTKIINELYEEID